MPEIERVSPYRFEAYQRSAEDEDQSEIEAYVENFPFGDTWTGVDGEGNLTITIGPEGQIGSVHVDDWIFKEFSMFWTIKTNTEFQADYALVET